MQFNQRFQGGAPARKGAHPRSCIDSESCNNSDNITLAFIIDWAELSSWYGTNSVTKPSINRRRVIILPAALPAVRALTVGIVEVAVEKSADTMLMPVSARIRLFELSDDMATRINIQFCSDTLLKALLE